MKFPSFKNVGNIQILKMPCRSKEMYQWFGFALRTLLCREEPWTRI